MFKNYSSILRRPLKHMLLVTSLSVSGLYAQTPVVKVDFDQAGRNSSEVSQLDYTPWVISSGQSSSLVNNGVTFTMNKVGSFGDELGTNWYKTGIQASQEGKLVNDGLTVKGGTANEGGQIEMHLSGLPAGNHTLMVYLNAVDSPDGNTFSPIDVSVQGSLVFNDVQPTVRAAHSAAAKSVYLKFEAIEGEDVVVLFAAETSGTENKKNVMLNGFELNTPNIYFQATNPIPSHNNEHVALDEGGLTLEWTAAESAVSHNIYFGNSLEAVESATISSSEYQGNQEKSETTFGVSGLYTGETYFWRVDQVYSDGSVETGNVWRFRPAQLAFPEAEGYGRFARGGRGGKVVAVTNLNDSGPGSLREAVTNDIGPRTVVFNVSGIIELKSRLVLSQSYVTIAGQTAPGKGITIKAAPFGVTGNDNVVQHLRVRLGGGQTYDGMGLTGADYSIIDHCSISWTIDESFSSRSGKHITLQRTLISEALNAAGHQNYPAGTEHGYAATIGGDIGSFHHNLLAHNYGRNWSLGGGLDGSGAYAGRMDITNNVVYNWGSRTTDGGTKEVNFVNNYYKPGAGSTLFYAFTAEHEGAGTGSQRCYFNGNVMPGYFDETNQEAGRRIRISNGAVVNWETFVDEPFFPSYVTTQSAKHAYKMVLSDVGCIQPEFDNHDKRIIQETLDGTFTYRGSVTGKPGFPDDESDVGGYENYPVIERPSEWDSDKDGLPDWWEEILGTNLYSNAEDFSDANADTNGDGYTNLDTFLQWMSQPHYSVTEGETLTVDLNALSKGFTSGTVYSVSETENAEIKLNGSKAEVTPVLKGLASFKFTVTDAEGDSMTRLVNIVNGYDSALSVSETDKQTGLKVWPVPSQGEVSVKFVQNFNNATFSVVDLLGKEVLNGTIIGSSTTQFKLQGKGVYILQVFDADSKQVLHTQKLIIK